ncbi:glycosyltransferase [Variovorax ginsengisoli]|uniref:Glycosyltransferase involved in cell wall biosynthesis n=1 Tax=Variovorax ginsengisoli TaxID=363844 RepID=A0ABT9S9H8_9BURK|nr:glycosyltransferase [Variovorax ginsengisoli]MDP9900032.1 glycosyltransferase involved in cell wall biosynthesis [Variovorax ginsengisoli]
MIGIVIPAHNEEESIGACVLAAMRAGTHTALAGEHVVVCVVLDHCRDRTASIAQAAGALTLSVELSNVGAARAAGATALLAMNARWLAFTDADTLVSPSWLVDQLSLQADAVCGSIGVDDWTPHGIHAASLAAHFRDTYSDCEGHRHIHGANLGVAADAYLRAGGFAPLACSEDVALVQALERSGARIAWSALPRVVTSARADARARGGFGDTLLAVTAARLAALAIPMPPTVPA